MIKNGWVVGEWYGSPKDKTYRQYLSSNGKSYSIILFGMVVARPEYRIRDLDGSLPHESVEDGISAMRWFKARAAQFGIDPNRVAAGGGSAGGCMASIVGTIDSSLSLTIKNRWPSRETS